MMNLIPIPAIRDSYINQIVIDLDPACTFYDYSPYFDTGHVYDYRIAEEYFLELYDDEIIQMARANGSSIACRLVETNLSENELVGIASQVCLSQEIVEDIRASLFAELREGFTDPDLFIDGRHLFDGAQRFIVSYDELVFDFSSEDLLRSLDY